MTKRKQMWIAILSAAALLCACVCGALPVAADDDAETVKWQETEDGQFLYTFEEYKQYKGKTCVQVVYIGNGDDVTVPATFGGKAADFVWFTNDTLGLEWFYEEGTEAAEQARAWIAKIRAAADRYLNISFEEGPTIIEVNPVFWPEYLLASSVTLPKSATEANLYVAGTETVTVPEESRLTKFLICNTVENVLNPTPTTIDLTRAAGLARVSIGLEDWMGDYCLPGSMLKLPTSFKGLPIYQRNHYPASEDKPYIITRCVLEPLTIQYADGTERPLTFRGDVNGDDRVDMKDVLCVRLSLSRDTERLGRLAHIGLDTVQKLGDLDESGEVDMKDVLCIRKFIAGLPV